MAFRDGFPVNKLSQKLGLDKLIHSDQDSGSLYKSINGDAFEALMVEDGHLTEGGAATLFMVHDGAMITHALGTDVLPGITRERVFTLAASYGIAIEERSVTTAELLSADELFITAATAFVMPIVRVDGVAIGDGLPGPITTRLRAGYIASVRNGAAAM